MGEHRRQAMVGSVLFGAAAAIGIWTIAEGHAEGIAVVAPAGLLAVLFVGEWRRPSSLTLDEAGWTSRSVTTGTLRGRWDRCGPFRVHRGSVACATATLEPPQDLRSRLYRGVRRRQVLIPRGDDSFNGGPVEMSATDLARMLNRFRDHYGGGGPANV